ncbi:DUF547 domain-containing protein [uncultured Neptuniibacter sp.]|uniref:DUF547 domain-containing protein n=1 Tax=uncultured Neptuniibacter sp. TaxID=502143 RepID=UPI00260C4185|nr:DUF547 domain-containing protein [uncultured Neptuniibacter sp.]
MKHFKLILLVLILPLPLHAAPEAELWEYWRKDNSNNTAQINHQIWQQWLDRYVARDESGVNRVSYSKVTMADRQRLQEYINTLGTLPIRSYNAAEQKAYWINLYNALTVNLILAHYPVTSITEIDISPGLFSNGPWGKKLITIEDQPLSLDDIEHRILRPIWMDPRLHYTLNCASIGCPDLHQTAFTALNSEQLLDDNARRFINHPRGVRFENRKLIVSKIYSWFQTDFGSSEKAVIKHLQQYSKAKLRSKLEGLSTIDRYEYNWKLNELKIITP